MKNSYRHFTNRQCEYFPCHETDNPDSFNCLFCFCPLYRMGAECGGNFSHTENGIKDCSRCLVPHSEGGYDYVIRKLKEESNEG